MAVFVTEAKVAVKLTFAQKHVDSSISTAVPRRKLKRDTHQSARQHIAFFSHVFHAAVDLNSERDKTGTGPGLRYRINSREGPPDTTNWPHGDIPVVWLSHAEIRLSPLRLTLTQNRSVCRAWFLQIQPS